jgi:hypothetical protein
LGRLDFGFIKIIKRKIQAFVVGNILKHVKSIVIISIAIIAVIGATEHLMDYNDDFGFKTPPYPEQLTIWKVEFLPENTARLIIINIGNGEVTINNVQVNGINGTFEPITLLKHNGNDDFRVTLQNETFILGRSYEFVATTTKGSHFSYKATYNQTS